MSKREPGPHTLARAWARENGIDIGKRGTVPTVILDRWKAANAALAAWQQPEAK